MEISFHVRCITEDEREGGEARGEREEGTRRGETDPVAAHQVERVLAHVGSRVGRVGVRADSDAERVVGDLLLKKEQNWPKLVRFSHHFHPEGPASTKKRRT